MGEGYEGLRDYGIVIELLRGNLVKPVTPPTHHVSPLYIIQWNLLISDTFIQRTLSLIGRFFRKSRIMTLEEQRTHQWCFVAVEALFNIKLLACVLYKSRL